MSRDIAGALLAFWRDAGMGKWFRGGEAFDAECRTRWLDDAEGSLALLILLDQIPRNIFRGSGHAFATDPLAVHVATRAIDAGFDAQVDPLLRMFCYLPFEHSEALRDQDRAIELFTALGDANLLGYANAHRDVIVQFGRFPHRNAALGRENTPAEQAWLEAGGGF